MLKKFYVLAWFLLVGATVVSVFTGSLNEIGMLAFGLIALALVHSLGLWAAFKNSQQMYGE